MMKDLQVAATKSIRTYTQISLKNVDGTTNASEIDKKIAMNGWFVPDTDLNLKNVTLKYLIQNAIWWDLADLDGFRIDTWPPSSLSATWLNLYHH
jgi:hypothetical protein